MMPFIRYRLGDRVTLGEAPGGSAGPYTTLRSIEGRTLDRFILPDGRAVLNYVLGEAVEESGLRIRRFQIVQERPEAFRISLFLYEPPRGELDGLAGRLRGILGPAVRACIDIVPALTGTGSRKFSPYVSFEHLSTGAMADARDQV